MKIIHVSPTYFSESSVIGGGERYPMELTKAMSKYVETELISFGIKRVSNFFIDELKIKIYPARYLIRNNSANPFSLFFLRELRGADVIHCHQYQTLITNLCVLYAKLFRKKVFVTDLGGGGLNIAPYIDIGRLVDGFLLISDYSARGYRKKYKSKVNIIYGGVDTGKFYPMEVENENKVLFVGRLLPHKGINYLVEAIPEKVQLKIIGKVYHEEYYDYLLKLSEGKDVEIQTDVSDDELVREFSSAMVTVLPSVYYDVYGNYNHDAELFGLTLIESMACGTPVICTNVGGMPEVVEDGVTGFVVPPNDSEAIRENIKYLIENPDVAKRMGENGRMVVEEKFTWDSIARKCLDVYSTA